MKRLYFLIVIGIVCIGLGFAQENQNENNVNLYTFFVNIVDENFRFPLIGFVNIAGGSHSLPQIGFINWNQNNFSSLQAGFVNTVGGDMKGFQAGFINTVNGNMNGLQMGFVNTVAKSFNGAQIGFVNTVAGQNMQGLQLGFINTAANGFDGTQISFVNVAGKINGFQLGFINYAEHIENGLPFGFISIVRNGGFRAIELSINEVAPISTAFKIGVDKLYTSINVSYNPQKNEIRDSMYLGIGIGTNISINNNFFFNPEIVTTNNIRNFNQSIYSFVPSFGFNIISGLSVLVGPSITWRNTVRNNELPAPLFYLYKFDFNDRNDLLIGGRLALRFQWQ